MLNLILGKKLWGCMFSLWSAVVVHLAGVAKYLKFNVVHWLDRLAPGGVAVEATGEQRRLILCSIGLQ